MCVMTHEYWTCRCGVLHPYEDNTCSGCGEVRTADSTADVLDVLAHFPLENFSARWVHELESGLIVRCKKSDEGAFPALYVRDPADDLVWWVADFKDEKQFREVCGDRIPLR